RYEQEDADELFILDISGKDRETFLEIVREIADNISIPLAVGGGIRTIDDVDAVLNAGAKKASITSAAISNPDLLKEAAAKHGSERVVLSIDAKKVDTNKWHAFT